MDSQFPPPEQHFIKPTPYTPNSRLPVLVYRDVIPHDEDGATQSLTRNGWWKEGTWGVIKVKHFHPNTHECYGVFSGHTEYLLGVAQKDDTSSGTRVTVKAGDVIIIPAGVAHSSTSGSDDYKYIGIYPDGAPTWRNEYGKRLLTGRNDKVLKEIASVRNPPSDPVYGPEGPLVTVWSGIGPEDENSANQTILGKAVQSVLYTESGGPNVGFAVGVLSGLGLAQLLTHGSKDLPSSVWRLLPGH